MEDADYGKPLSTFKGIFLILVGIFLLILAVYYSLFVFGFGIDIISILLFIGSMVCFAIGFSYITSKTTCRYCHKRVPVTKKAGLEYTHCENCGYHLNNIELMNYPPMQVMATCQNCQNTFQTTINPFGDTKAICPKCKTQNVYKNDSGNHVANAV